MKLWTTILISLIVNAIACQNSTLSPVCGNFGNKCYGVWTEHFKDPQLVDEDHAIYMRKLAGSHKGLVGECKFGTPTCDANGNIIDCKGVIYPMITDECNGLDEDCDGWTDRFTEYPSTSKWWWYDEPNPCGSDLGVCADARINCIKGRFVCNLPSTYRTHEGSADCDNLDNDCNGFVDDIVLECTDLLGNPISCACYEGPIGTELNDPCHNGRYECIHGALECVGQSLPRVEICDGIDNDCNGIIDDTEETLNQFYDVVFIIDNSGSMCVWIDAVTTALATFVDQFQSSSNFRFAVVIMNQWYDSDGDSELEAVVLREDFTGLEQVQNFISSLGCNGEAFEASLDSIHMTCDPTNPLGLSWGADTNKLALVFTDEPAQTYEDPPILSGNCVDICLLSSTVVHIWHHSWYNDSDLTDIATYTGGQYHYLRFGEYPEDEWQPILDDLNSTVISICIP